VLVLDSAIRSVAPNVRSGGIGAEETEPYVRNGGEDHSDVHSALQWLTDISYPTYSYTGVSYPRCPFPSLTPN